MEIGRKWRFSCLLLGLFFLATTLQGVQGEVESEGPSESECRPYIEKALKELETAEAEHLEPRTPSDGDGESTEDIPIVEQTIDDSEHVPSGGEDDIEEIETKETEQEGASIEQEATEDSSIQAAESKEAGDEEEQVAASAEQTEDQPGESQEEHIEDQEPTEEQAGESQEQADEPQAEPAEEAQDTVEQVDEVAEAEEETEAAGESIEEQEAEAEEAKSLEAEVEEGDEAAIVEETAAQSQEVVEDAEAQSVEVADEATAEEVVEEGEKSAEEAREGEEAIKSAEEAVEDDAAKSVEEAEKSTEEEDAAKSAEEAAASVEEAATSAEEAAASVEEATASAEEATTSAEEGAASVEEAAASVEEATASAEETAASAEEAAASAEEAAASAEEAAASAEEAAASAEKTAASAEEAAASAEKAAGSVEEAAPSAEEAAASAEEAAASAEEAAASAEEAAASAEEVATSAEKAAASVEETAASAEEAAAEEKSAEEVGKSVEEQDEEKPSDEGGIVKRSIPDGAEAPEDTKGEEEGKSAEAEADGESLEELAEPAEATETASAEAAEEKEGEAEEEQKEEVPEEDLTLEIEIPENLRPRDHIEQLLKLEDTEAESVLNRISEVTLRELKRLYEHAIKPLETLYKYRDLSNRHFGDSEVFSKPLVLFMGPWSGGKSSIINYLLDNEYNTTSLRTGAEPSPAYFNILMHGDEPEVLDGTQLAADFTFAGLQKFGQGLEERLRGLKLPSKLLEKINIVEIPGILEVRKQVSRIFPFNDACQWFIDRADIIFLVYDPSKLDVGPETEAILDQLKGREHQTRIVLNKADQVKPEELMRVQSALIWNISPLMSSAQPPVMYTTSLWSRPYETWAPVRLLQAQERAFLRDLRSAVDKRIENKISSARRFAVRVRNHAKMVDCYLTTYYNHKSVFGNRKQVSDQIIENPQDYHIYEGLSTLTNISRYDLPDPDVYRDFFRLNPLYDFQQLSATCTYFRGCPINRLDVAIAYDLPEMVGKHKKMVEAAMAELKTES